jgi:NAD-reducing hydrogenase small subunit
MDRIKFATVWLGGCSGCHMSFLDMDEWLIELAEKITLVYSPLADIKEYPENVDVVFVEGALASDEHIDFIQEIRERSKILVSFGDCAVTGNVTAMRSPYKNAKIVLERSYIEAVDINPQIPAEEGILPVLIDRVKPIHEVVQVDVFLPGCPPPAEKIRRVIEALLKGEKPVFTEEDLKNG